MKLNDLFAMKAVGKVAISADGNRVAFELKRFDLEQNKAYSLVSLNLVAFTKDSLDEAASFFLAQALVYRNTGGSAKLRPASTIPFIRVDSGGASSTTWTANLVENGNDVDVEVKGALLDVDWCLDFNFVEVLGE